MVHVRKCPYGERGKASTEFYFRGKPQIYCLGWQTPDGDPLEICMNCKDWVFGEQIMIDVCKEE